MAVIQLVIERPLCRARAARRLIDWYTQAAIRECALAVQVLPEEVLADREGLAAPASPSSCTPSPAARPMN